MPKLAPGLLRAWLFCTLGYRKKKGGGAFEPSVAYVHASVPFPDMAGTQVAPEWHNPGSLSHYPSLGGAGVLFNLFHILKPLRFLKYWQAGLSFSLVTMLLRSSLLGIREGRQGYWFSVWSFQEYGLWLWLCFSVASQPF